MDKIVLINYQGRTFSFEEKAYQLFQDYENKLKNYFSKEEGGDEIISDLQFRMAEILEQQSMGKESISNADIESLMSVIGNPSDFENEHSETNQEKSKESSSKEKKLFRNKKEKIIAGVCSGIANYFAIDPIVVRLMFILLTLFNVATLFTFNLGILGYIILWVVLTPKDLEPNILSKLYRNPKDQVLGGVCSGLAQFFNTDAWIIRLIFIAPIVLGFASNHTFSRFDFNIIGNSFYSLSFISYLILWFIIPLAKSSTDYMLMKGEPINITTIQQTTTMQTITNTSQSGVSKFLKVIAYLVLSLILMIAIPSAIGLVVGIFYSYSLADIVLFSDYNKILALLSIAFFLVLPIVGLIIWIIRKVAGIRSSSKILRITFIGLNIVGWAATIFLIASLANDNKTYTTSKTQMLVESTSDTLFINGMDTATIYNEAVFYEFNEFDHLIDKKKDVNEIKAVRIHYRESTDSLIRIVIEKSGSGANKDIALNNATNVQFTPILEGNVLKMPHVVKVSNKAPYHFQNVLVTVYYPKNKTIITSGELKKQLKHTFRADRSGINIHINEEENEILNWEDGPNEVIRVTNNTLTIVHDNDQKQEQIKEAQEQLKEVSENNLNQLKEKQKELEELQKQSNLEIERARKELDKAINDKK
jgi:phage shock protein PspC (stress-responsive transcriptional regulator)